MNIQQMQRILSPRAKVTGQDKRGDCYFQAQDGRVGVVRSCRSGFVVLVGSRGSTDGYWVRRGCEYSYHKYPVYTEAVACRHDSLRDAIVSIFGG